MEKVSAMKKIALFMMIVGLAVALVACQGPVGKPGDKGETGDKGDPADPTTVLTNTPPALKAGKVLGTQYFALASAGIDGTEIPATGNRTTGRQALGKLKLSDYFEDAEGVINLIYSVAELSDDDKKVVDVYLLDMDPRPNGINPPNGFVVGTESENTPVTASNSKSSVTGEDSYLAIAAKAPGSVTLTLTVKDGLPGGVAMQNVSVTVVAANAPPLISTALDTPAELEAFDKTGADRLVVSEGAVTIDLPAMSFVDPNGDALTYEAIIGAAGDDADIIAANKKVIDAAVNDSGDLVVTPKAAPAAEAVAIPITIKVSDIYGASVTTGTPIDIAVNRPPVHRLYSESESPEPPTGRKDTDKAVLADLATTTFSIATTTVTAETLLTLDGHFVDNDALDVLNDDNIANGVCNFTDRSGDKATVAFNSDRTAITIVGEEQGSFDVTVTCTDTKKESLVDSVTVTIIG